MADDFRGVGLPGWLPEQPSGNSSAPSLFDMVSGRAGGAEGFEQAAANHPRTIEDPTQIAQQGGTSLQGLAAGFFPQQMAHGQGYNIPSDQGGFFTAEDLFRQSGRDVPQIGTFQSNAPSTNNWRLLGMGPGWIMRNGQLIDTNANGTRWGGPASFTPSGGNSGEQSMPARGTALGAGVGFGVPNMLQAGLGQPTGYGWPGAAQWFSEGGMLSSTY
jgi:hypothetical protein